MVSQAGTRVVRHNSCKGPKLSWRRAKGPNQILGPANVIWDQIYEIWHEESKPGNPDSNIGK